LQIENLHFAFCILQFAIMSAREDILAQIRRHTAADAALPGHEGPWIQYSDPCRQFTEALASVGGQWVVVGDVASATARLEGIPEYRAARKRCSLVPGVGDSTFDLAAIADPHELEDVEFAVLPGEFAVAENGAVWVTDEVLAHRVLFFLPQHLAVVVSARNIVHNLHEAYERAVIGRSPFAAFVSGPSKTADIEQALVIGAHGARSLTVFLLESGS
jgi:L-lactate dehydrogenase complex protein LldG